MNRVACFAILALACLIRADFSAGQDRARVVSLIELVSNPERYDQELVNLQGYLTFSHEKHRVIAAFLYLHKEDAMNLLPNEVTVVPSEQMLRDEEKIDRIYVSIVGVLRSMPGADGSHVLAIKDVRSCRAWSDPHHPIGAKSEYEIRDSDHK